MSELKQKAAYAALEYIEDNIVLGVGTGSTVNFLIDALSKVKHRLDACVASSKATEMRLKAAGIPVIDLNVAGELPLYIDGADEITKRKEAIKGGGGALTREKVLATASQQFICIIDESKLVSHLGMFPVAVEVLPLARSFVAREVVKLGGDPAFRENFITDNGNIILDVYNFTITHPLELEKSINLIPGVVENGLFAQRLADKVIVGQVNGVMTF